MGPPIVVAGFALASLRSGPERSGSLRPSASEESAPSAIKTRTARTRSPAFFPSRSVFTGCPRVTRTMRDHHSRWAMRLDGALTVFFSCLALPFLRAARRYDSHILVQGHGELASGFQRQLGSTRQEGGARTRCASD